MNWIQNLHDTYEAAYQTALGGARPLPGEWLLPICHTTQKAHIEVTLSGNGAFLRAKVLPRDEMTTIIPCTEASGGRAGKKPVCHPLADKLQYVAGDFGAFGGDVTSGFSSNPAEPFDTYVELLDDWVKSDPSPKTSAVLKYVRKRRLIKDLVQAKILQVGPDGKLLKRVDSEHKDKYPLMSVLGPNELPENSFVRWSVEIAPGDPNTSLSTDQRLWRNWIDYYEGTKKSKGICLVTGKESLLAEQHPAKLRHSGDKAKLISSNDSSGFTFRGRFVTADQACGVGFEVTQKAHNALRWLVGRQGERSGDPTVVSWAVSGKKIPPLLANTEDMIAQALADFGESVTAPPDPRGSDSMSAPSSDVGQTFAIRLNKLMAGYSVDLGSAEGIVVMALDSATPGRMAIIYYRELTGSEFLARVERWHASFAWQRRFLREASGSKKAVGRTVWKVCAPAPKEIAEAAYGWRIDAKLRRATVERLLPCIVDAMPLPMDLLESCVRRASNRQGMDHWEWEKTLGIACGLFRGFHSERSYEMSLETQRNSRDYLYGRLLAIAEHMEERALYLGGETRDTTAAKLMQRFADRPFSTWLTVEKSLTPYKTRLQSKRPQFLHLMMTLLDEVHGSFLPKEYESDKKLSGEYLLGYHCQRLEWQAKPDVKGVEDSTNSDGKEGGE